MRSRPVGAGVRGSPVGSHGYRGWTDRRDWRLGLGCGICRSAIRGLRCLVGQRVGIGKAIAGSNLSREEIIGSIWLTTSSDSLVAFHVRVLGTSHVCATPPCYVPYLRECLLCHQPT